MEIVELLTHIFETHKEELSLVGITSETKLLEVLAKNGAPTVIAMMEQLRTARMAHTNQP